MDVIISLLQQMSVYLVVAYLFSKTPILKSLFAVSMRLPPKATIYVVFSGSASSAPISASNCSTPSPTPGPSAPCWAACWAVR